MRVSKRGASRTAYISNFQNSYSTAAISKDANLI
jgi:hypothetical protein